MFVGKATFRAVDCVQNIAQVRLVHSNDNLVHRMARAPHAPALVCHWRIVPATGKPECHWGARHATPINVPSESRGPASIGSMRCVHAAAGRSHDPGHRCAPLEVLLIVLQPN
jgi:hypothetical protein